MIKKAGRPKIDLEMVFTKIKPYLQLGYKLHKACLLGDIAYSTIKPYYDNDDNFRNKIDRERSIPSMKAREVWVKAIVEGGDLQASQEWLSTQEKEDFSKTTEIKDITERTDEGLLILREIIQARRIKAKKQNELGEGKK